MAKKVGINYDKEHFKRIEAYVRKIQLLYLRTGQQATQFVKGVKYNDEFTFDKFPAVKKKIDKLIGEMNTTMELSIQQMNKTEWMEACYKGDALIALYASKVNIPTTLLERYQSRNMEALAAFQQRKINGLNLSDRVWRYTNQFKGELELALDIGLGEGRSAAQLSRDVRSYLNNPDTLFRRVKNKYGNLKLSKHAKQYHPGPGAYRSAYKNAMRLTRTETNMAYRKADYEKNQQFDFVVGIEVKRSNHFFACPVCESLKGRYPKSFVFTGWHPQCRCFCVSILATQEEFIQHQKKLLAGEESVLKSKNEVHDVPKGFKEWMDENIHRMKSDTQVYDINKEWERIRKVQIDLTQIYGKDTDKVKFRLATPEQTIKVGDFNKVNERINIDIEFPVNIIKSDGTVIKSSGFNSSMIATIDNDKKIITLMKVDVDEKLRRNGIAEYMAWKVKEVTPKGYTIVGSGVYSGGGSGLVAKLEKTGYFKNVSVPKRKLPYWMKENKKYINNAKSMPYFIKDNEGLIKYIKPINLTEKDILNAITNNDCTEQLFQVDGDWTAERKILHDKIIKEIAGAESSQTNQVFMLGGGTANGKSTLVKSKMLPYPEKIVTIDSDAIKAMIPEYNEMLRSGNQTLLTNAANFVHEESSFLAKRVQAELIKQNKDFILDGINDGGIEKLQKKIFDIKSHGKRIRADYVSLSTDKSLELAAKRAIATGRKVPLDVILDSNREISVLFPKIVERNLIDELYLWDTNIRGTPRLVFTQINGKTTIHNQELYTNFLKKAKYIH